MEIDEYRDADQNLLNKNIKQQIHDTQRLYYRLYDLQIQALDTFGDLKNMAFQVSNQVEDLSTRFKVLNKALRNKNGILKPCDLKQVSKVSQVKSQNVLLKEELNIVDKSLLQSRGQILRQDSKMDQLKIQSFQYIPPESQKSPDNIDQQAQDGNLQSNKPQIKSQDINKATLDQILSPTSTESIQPVGYKGGLKALNKSFSQRSIQGFQVENQANASHNLPIHGLSSDNTSGSIWQGFNIDEKLYNSKSEADALSCLNRYTPQSYVIPAKRYQSNSFNRNTNSKVSSLEDEELLLSTQDTRQNWKYVKFKKSISCQDFYYNSKPLRNMYEVKNYKNKQEDVDNESLLQRSHFMSTDKASYRSPISMNVNNQESKKQIELNNIQHTQNIQKNEDYETPESIQTSQNNWKYRRRNIQQQRKEPKTTTRNQNQEYNKGPEEEEQQHQIQQHQIQQHQIQQHQIQQHQLQQHQLQQHQIQQPQIQQQIHTISHAAQRHYQQNGSALLSQQNYVQSPINKSHNNISNYNFLLLKTPFLQTEKPQSQKHYQPDNLMTSKDKGATCGGQSVGNTQQNEQSIYQSQHQMSGKQSIRIPNNKLNIRTNSLSSSQDLLNVNYRKEMNSIYSDYSWDNKLNESQKQSVQQRFQSTNTFDDQRRNLSTYLQQWQLPQQEQSQQQFQQQLNKQMKLQQQQQQLKQQINIYHLKQQLQQKQIEKRKKQNQLEATKEPSTSGTQIAPSQKQLSFSPSTKQTPPSNNYNNNDNYVYSNNKLKNKNNNMSVNNKLNNDNDNDNNNIVNTVSLQQGESGQFDKLYGGFKKPPRSQNQLLSKDYSGRCSIESQTPTKKNSGVFADMRLGNRKNQRKDEDVFVQIQRQNQASIYSINSKQSTFTLAKHSSQAKRPSVTSSISSSIKQFGQKFNRLASSKGGESIAKQLKSGLQSKWPQRAFNQTFPRSKTPQKASQHFNEAPLKGYHKLLTRLQSKGQKSNLSKPPSNVNQQYYRAKSAPIQELEKYKIDRSADASESSSWNVSSSDTHNNVQGALRQIIKTASIQQWPPRLSTLDSMDQVLVGEAQANYNVAKLSEVSLNPAKSPLQTYKMRLLDKQYKQIDAQQQKTFDNNKIDSQKDIYEQLNHVQEGSYQNKSRFEQNGRKLKIQNYSKNKLQNLFKNASARQRSNKMGN